ncbi:hypothetical protein ACFE04_013955 [Oxalis oulophora]
MSGGDSIVVKIEGDNNKQDDHITKSISATPRRVSFAGTPSGRVSFAGGSPSRRLSFAGGSPSRSVLKNPTSRRSVTLARTKTTKSRLLDLSENEESEVRSPREGGTVPRKSGHDFTKPDLLSDEDDPLFDDEIPEDYKREKVDIWFILEWVCLVLIVAALICSLTVPSLKAREIWSLKLWKWEVLILVLICGRLVSGWMIRIIVFCVERNFLLRKRVLYFVYGLKHAVQNCIWLGLVLLAWHFLFDRKVETETNLKYVTKILDSLFNQYVIETLSGPPLVEIQEAEVDKAQVSTLPPGLSPKKSPRASASSFNSDSSKKERINIDRLHRLNTKNVSAWNMKRLVNLVRTGSLSTLDEQLKDSIHGDENTTKIRSEKEAKAAARKILFNVAKPGCKFIYIEDLLRFMLEDEALKTMSLFEEGSQTNRISKSALKIWVVEAFRERRALALTLNDTKTAVNKLHKIVNFMVAILIIVIWLLMLEIATSRFLLFMTSQLVVVAFIFGNTCKTVFESIIFLFVMHPFDVGDRCEIDGVQMVVEEMNILTSVFLRFDNQKIMYPNSVLLNKSIANYYRSPDMGDAVEFCVHIATPAEKIAMMRQRITSYIENKKDHWYPTPLIIIRDLDELNRLRIAVWLTHRMNHQNMGERYSRRSMLIEEMIKIFKELDIQYRLYPIDVNVRAIPPLR